MSNDGSGRLKQNTPRAPGLINNAIIDEGCKMSPTAGVVSAEFIYYACYDRKGGMVLNSLEVQSQIILRAQQGLLCKNADA